MLAIGGVGGLAVGLAGREILENLFTGLIILSSSPFEVGDEVQFSPPSGSVRPPSPSLVTAVLCACTCACAIMVLCCAVVTMHLHYVVAVSLPHDDMHAYLCQWLMLCILWLFSVLSSSASYNDQCIACQGSEDVDVQWVEGG